MILLYLFLTIYFGFGLYLLVIVQTNQGTNYALAHPFGGLAIFLFGPIAAIIFLLFPRTRQAVRDAARRDSS
jgi:hypothetical protein